jgi:chemotaxis-related protein WspD
MTTLPVLPASGADCWNRIGIHGDRSCPELAQVVHCHNCPVFAAAGRRFLDAPSPEGYLAEWTDRLAAPIEETVCDLESVLVFRIGREWLALPVHVLVEVTALRPVHHIPYRGGLLAGLVNIRGELYLCVKLGRLLGTADGESAAGAEAEEEQTLATARQGQARMLVVRRDADRWVFAADAVDQVLRVPRQELGPVPATVKRAAAHLTRGLFTWHGRAIGLLDELRLFDALRTKIR